MCRTINRQHFKALKSSDDPAPWPSAKTRGWAKYVCGNKFARVAKFLPESALDRDDVLKYCAKPSHPTEACFCAIMAWGGMNRNQDGQPSHDAIDECLFQEGREPRSHDGDLLHALQFRAHPSNAQGHARDCGWRHFQTLGNV